jgi:hypothetical protein
VLEPVRKAKGEPTWRHWDIELGSAKSCMNGLPCNSIFEHLNDKYQPRLIALDSLHLELLGRFLATVRHNLIFDYLSLIESAQTRALDSRDMNEYVLAPALRLDEPVSLGWIEPLYSSRSH